MSETISGLLINGSIPLSVTLNSSTNWTQFFLTAFITIMASFGLIIIVYSPYIIGIIRTGSLLRLVKFTKRNLVLIKHTEQALFSSSMIDDRTLRELTRIMNEMNGEDFDIVLHTPGGQIFSSLAISRLIKQYPGHIRAIVPLYSMSGGSLLALSCGELLMSPNASLGPIDPQLGSLFKFGSAKAWEEIVKFKGKRAEDQSISFAMMGKQYTKSIQAQLDGVIDFELSHNQKKKLIQFLTDGNIEHARPLTATDLSGFGVPVSIIQNTDFLRAMSKIISSVGKEGVSYYKIPNWRRMLWQAGN
jgi:hypothetical protein